MKRFVFGTVCAFMLGATLGACSSGASGEPPPEEQKPHGENPLNLEDYPAIQEFLEKVEQAHAGETVDFIGDGSTTRIWFDENGVRHFEGNGPASNPYRYISETHPDDSYKTTYSVYADGVIDTQEEQRGDGTRVTLYDTDRDGEFDKRVTLTLTDDPEFFRVIEEERTSEGGWSEVRNELVPTTVESLSDEAEFLSDEAESLSDDALNEPQASRAARGAMLGINFVTSGHGSCSPKEQQRVLDAIRGIIENSLPCLAATRPAMAKRITDAMSGKHHVAFYCGFENDSRGNERMVGFAQPNLSKGWTCSARFPCVIKVNRDHLNHAISKDLQGTVLHELLHTLGFNNDTSPEEHDKGTDETYSCERYCAGCIGHGPGFQSSNIDCTRCADTPTRKLMCGIKLDFVPGVPAEGPLVCNTSRPPTGHFEDILCTIAGSRIGRFAFCDGSVGGVLSEANEESLEEGWTCCDECPCTTHCETTTNNNNGVPCDVFRRMLEVVDFTTRCTDSPPFCR